MSACTASEITCDECGAFVRGDQTIAELRKQLRGEGWSNKGEVDTCPDCIKNAGCQSTFYHPGRGINVRCQLPAGHDIDHYHNGIRWAIKETP